MSRSTRLVSTINQATIGLLAKSHPNGVSLLRRADSGSGLDDGWAKAQPAVVLILKRLRKRGHGFKSHPADWEKPVINKYKFNLKNGTFNHTKDQYDRAGHFIDVSLPTVPGHYY